MEKENSSPRVFGQMDLHGNVQRKGSFTPYQHDQEARLQPLENWQHNRATPQYQEAKQQRAANTSFHPSKGYSEQNIAVGSAYSQAREPAEVSMRDVKIIVGPQHSFKIRYMYAAAISLWYQQ